MSRKKSKPGPAARPPVTQPSTSSAFGRSLRRPVFAAGLVALALAAAASLVLALQHLGGMALPGCGPGSACGALTHGPWGSIPGLGWPVSFLGLAWFVALGAAWSSCGGALPRILRWPAFMGAAFSVLLIAVMVGTGHLCPYCLAVHAGNLAFVAIVLAHPEGVALARLHLAPILGSFLGVSAVLGFALHFTASAARDKAEEQLAVSTRAMLDTNSKPQPAESAVSASAGFTGRWREGLEAAPVRIVIFSDYQCVDCNRIEAEVRDVMARHPEASLSAKHFPFNSECNPSLAKSMHPNACWAARAAEAAGILRGNDGFWQMHRWLFDRQGGFTDAELSAGLRQLGYDEQAFLRLMQSDETLMAVRADVEEAVALGLYFTPMIFINGVELKGWNATQALSRTVDAVAASKPPALTAAADHPPSAFERYIADWREAQPRGIAYQAQTWALGPGTAAVEVVVFGDYQDDKSAELNRRIRAFQSGKGGIRYTFRPFPFDQSCNANVPRTAHASACRAARAVEAAGRLGGAEAWWRMHGWLLEHPQELNDDSVRAAAAAAGLDGSALLVTMEDPAVAAALAQDVDAGRQAGLQGLPSVFVAEKLVPRWQLGSDPVLERILEEAVKDTAAGTGPGD